MSEGLIGKTGSMPVGVTVKIGVADAPGAGDEIGGPPARIAGVGVVASGAGEFRAGRGVRVS